MINRTLHSIHSTLKDISLQIDPDWSEKEKEKLSLESLESEESEEESEEEKEENPEEMTLDEEGVEKLEEAKGKAKEFFFLKSCI